MRILNTHERLFRASPQQVAEILDTLSGPDDRIWPWDRWPRMDFDAPLGRGARGGHGPVRYAVSEYVPGKKVTFEFENTGASAGLNGCHLFEIVPESDGVVFRHVVDAECGPAARLRWMLLLEPLHDALLEDCLDRVESALNGKPTPEQKWTPWVRFVRWVIRRVTRS